MVLRTSAVRDTRIPSPPPYISAKIVRRQRWPLAGRDNFSLDAVGSSGDLAEELEAHPCVASRYTKAINLE